MPRSCECPKCGSDISDSYESADPDVGILVSGWSCDCGEFVQDDDEGYDDYLFSTSQSTQDPSIPEHSSGKCPRCNVLGEMGYGLAGGGVGPYTYCPSCGMILSKSQDG